MTVLWTRQLKHLSMGLNCLLDALTQRCNTAMYQIVKTKCRKFVADVILYNSSKPMQNNFSNFLQQRKAITMKNQYTTQN